MTSKKIVLCLIALSISAVVATNCAPFQAIDSRSFAVGSSGSGSGNGGLGSIPQSATKTPYGLNVDFNMQSFADLFQPTTNFTDTSGNAITGDAQGWPQQDFAWLIDNRYTQAWINTPNADPAKFAVDLSGTYTLTFKGQASMSAGYCSLTVSNVNYNSATNTTTAQVTLPVVPTGTLFCQLLFKSTKRNAADAPGNGLTDVHLYRPGYSASSPSIFTDAWLHQIRDYPWSALRFMGATGTSDYAQDGSSEAYPYLLTWNDRLKPGRGGLYAQNHPGNHGLPWEYVIQAANETNRDPWINVPVNASDDYIKNMAQLFHDQLHSSAIIYVEYSNEMWHEGFPQGPWNHKAAADEVASGNSNLNYDGVGDQNIWRFRRIAKRTIEINRIFKQVFADRPDHVRTVINNAWPAFYADMLNYVTKQYGPPGNDIYAISVTGYYSSANTSSADSIISGEMAASDTSNRMTYLRAKSIATFYGVHLFVYEGGEGEVCSPAQQWGNPPQADPDIAAKFAASRDPRMQQVIVNDVINNWYPAGGDLYMQFSQVSGYSVFGFWGLSEDLNNIMSGKWLGAKQVIAATKPGMTLIPALPFSTGATVSVNEAGDRAQNWVMPSRQPWTQVIVNALVAGSYSIQVQGLQKVAGQMPLYVDNQLAGNVNLPMGSTPALSNAVPVNLTAGLHSIFVYSPPGASDQGVTIADSDAMVIRKN